MKITGIIAEYNPFHNGHAYQIQTARANGATHVVCVMSGNFTQRGDVAVMDKLSRARCALESGADLVLELPAVYALGSAGVFAKGSVGTLLATGCLDALHFGSECGDINLLQKTAAAIEQVETLGAAVPKQAAASLIRGQALLEQGFEKEAAILESPNNLLGVEYLLALRKAYSHVATETVLRKGAEHDSFENEGEICSASQLRRMLVTDPQTATQYTTQETALIFKERKNAGCAPITLKQLDTAILSRLRMTDPTYLSRIAGVSEGLENRIWEAIRACRSFEEICATVKTKRYPLSRIRRILLCAAIGITTKDQEIAPAYLRVLGQTERGNEVLRIMKHSAKLPIILRTSDFDQVSDRGRRLFRLENLATDLYTMAYEPMGECGSEYTQNIYSYTKRN
ncbi:MAG: nucleotidyltransferase family protein, partial [Clostridia bacterium]|nr:nucleotidyltransferase family protein [Clostridia bacterium]